MTQENTAQDTEQSLASYIATRLGHGDRRVDIEEDLRAIGWQEDDVQHACTKALIASGAPVPSVEKEGYGTSKSRASALEVVVHFFSFILLGIVSFSLGNMLFAIIEKHLPDMLSSSSYWYSSDATYYTDRIHYGIAALLVAFPLYYFVMRFWLRLYRADKGRVESRMSKWLTYVLLSVAALVVVGDLITVLSTFLQGEFTVRFILKALVVLGIAGGVFLLYVFERRFVQYKKSVSRKLFTSFGLFWAIAVALSIVGGFISAGLPAAAREAALDAQRAENLRALASCIDEYATAKKVLPTDISTFEIYEVENYDRYYYYYDCGDNIHDPETGDLYEYTSSSAENGAYSVELCATFTKASEDKNTAYSQDMWDRHEAGRSCDSFTVTISPNDSGNMLGAPKPLM